MCLLVVLIDDGDDVETEPSAHAIIDNFTCFNEPPPDVSITLMMILPILSVGNSLIDRDDGSPWIDFASVPDSGIKIISTLTIFNEEILTFRMIRPPLGRSILKVDVSSVISSPFEIKSCLLTSSLGLIRMAFVDMIVSIYSFSVHTKGVVVVLEASVVVWSIAVDA